VTRGFKSCRGTIGQATYTGACFQWQPQHTETVVDYLAQYINAPGKGAKGPCLVNN